MTDRRDKIIEVVGDAIAAERHRLKGDATPEDYACAALDAIRAAGYTIAPPGALVIPPLETKDGRKALVRAIDAYEAALDEDLCAMEEAIRAAGER